MKSPKVRFKGYIDDWEERKFSDYYKMNSGYAFKYQDYCESGVRLINGESIQHGKIDDTNLKFLPNNFLQQYEDFKLIEGDIVVGLNRPITNGELKIARISRKFNNSLLYQRAGKITYKANCDRNFSYVLLSQQILKYTQKEAVGSDQPFISTLKLDRWNMMIPSLVEEQKKIGIYFFNLNNLINLHQRKCEEIKTLKKYMLQKMFPQNGMNVPEIRFDGFTDTWEQHKFSDLVETRRGLTYKPIHIQSKGIRVLRSSNINEDQFIIKDDDVFVSENAINIEYAKENDILITAANGSSKLVGKHAIISKISDKSMVHGGFMLLGTAFEPFFANALMSSSWYKRFIDIYVSGGNGAIGNLNKNDLDNQDILIPSVPEQQKIGNYFRNFDSLITLHQQKCDELQSIKKFMLQNMFV